MEPWTVNGCSKYGAQMGRRSYPVGGLVHLRKVRLGQGGYDVGGAYWGTGVQLWCAWNEESGPTYLRAETREHAKAKLPGVEFYR